MLNFKILFDVGANSGTRFFEELKHDQTNTKLFMFEPTPYLIGLLKEKYKNLNNWQLEEYAVSNFNGEAKFKVAGQWDWGCSSLMNFREDIKQTWPVSRVTGDLKVTEIIKVKVKTLKQFLIENPSIDKIDFLHIDTQGSDLNVLKGLEEYIKIVDAGQMEAAYNAPLYDNSPSKDECIEFLQKNNFKILKIDGGPHECDIHFLKK
jgi:FkbM family methyltransferase